MASPHDHDAALPALEPLNTRLTEVEKRERQRLHVKRTYYRKLNLMNGLRDNVRQLEEEYDRLLAEKAKHDALGHAYTADHGTDSPIDVVHADTTPSSALGDHQSARQRYEEMYAIRKQLRVQNEALRKNLAEYERLAEKFKLWTAEESSTSSGEELAEVNAIERRLSNRPKPPKLLTPMTVEACQEIARSSFKDMQHFRESHGFLSTGVSVFGWRDKRLRQGDRVKFSMKKLFHGITPLRLWLQGWSVVSSPKLLPSLYSPSIDVKVHVIQRVDDDNQIMYRVMTSQDGRFLVKTLFLVTRFAIPNGYVHIFRSLDPSLLVPYQNPPGVDEQWIDYYNWTIYEAYGEGGVHCKLDFGGETQSNAVVGSDEWMLEVLFVILRWENNAIGPIFSIC